MNLKKFIQAGIFILAASQAITLLVCSCTKKEILEPVEFEMPPLEDSIPYDVLGSGKIVFERIGPYPGQWEGWYVIDVDRQKTWSLDFKRIVGLDAISPDGQKIVFSAYGIYTIHPDGSNPRQITQNGFGYMASWSPDSKKLYFRQGSPPRLYVQSAIPDAQDLRLVKKFTVRIEPGGPEWIIEPSGAVGISTQGKIAYACNWNRQRGLAGLYVMNDDGTNLSLILPLPENRYFDSPVFSLDNTQLYFFSIKKDSAFGYEQADLMQVDIDGAILQTIASFSIAGRQEWFYSEYKFTTLFLARSPDGHKLLFNLPEGDFVSHLYVLTIGGTDVTRVTTAAGVTDRLASWGQ